MSAPDFTLRELEIMRDHILLAPLSDFHDRSSALAVRAKEELLRKLNAHVQRQGGEAVRVTK